MSWFPLIWLGLVIAAIVALALLRPSRHVVWLVVVVLIVSFAGWVALPSNPGIRLDTDGDGNYEIDKPIAVRQGLDLAGGVRVLLEADIDETTPLPNGSMEEVRRIVDQRIDALGALEPVVQLRGERRIIVELPGFSDPESAVDLIQQTALLEFVDFGYEQPEPGIFIRTDLRDQQSGSDDDDAPEATSEATTEATAEATTEPATDPIPDPNATVYRTVMTGEILANADITYDELGNPAVQFTLTPDGADIFAEYTRAHQGQVLGIVLDGILVSAPAISTPITDGEGIIQGDFTTEEASQLATQLRYGALPVPLRVESTSTIGPTLGQISVEQSIRAGVIGISVVLLFMLIYYRVPGVAAALALLTFAVLNFALYKFIPITLTLPAITGFLISVGTAVDGNILIFERIKEELRKGKRLDPAVEAGFSRAWTSIRDSNFSTIIICIVLYLFGTSFGAGAVRGFAVTLALGLFVNLFTAVTVTRTFLHFILKPLSDETIAAKPWLMGLAKSEEAKHV